MACQNIISGAWVYYKSKALLCLSLHLPDFLTCLPLPLSASNRSLTPYLKPFPFTSGFLLSPALSSFLPRPLLALSIPVAFKKVKVDPFLILWEKQHKLIAELRGRRATILRLRSNLLYRQRNLNLKSVTTASSHTHAHTRVCIATLVRTPIGIMHSLAPTLTIQTTCLTLALNLT